MSRSISLADRARRVRRLVKAAAHGDRTARAGLARLWARADILDLDGAPGVGWKRSHHQRPDRDSRPGSGRPR